MLLLIFLTLYATVTLLQLAKLNRRFGSWSILQIVSCIVMLTFVPVVWYTTYIYPLGCEHYFNIIAYNLPTWCALWGRKFPLPTHQKWVPDFKRGDNGYRRRGLAPTFMCCVLDTVYDAMYTTFTATCLWNPMVLP